MNVSDLIQSLGGTTSLAKLLGIGPSAISNWKAAGRIPLRWYLPLKRQCDRQDLIIEESLFEGRFVDRDEEDVLPVQMPEIHP